MTTPQTPAATPADKPIREPVAPPPSTGNVDPTRLPFFKEDFVFLDTESTGLDPEVDKLCEIALVRYRGGQREVFHTLIDPGFPMPPTASAVNHITDEMIREAKAPRFEEIADKVMEMLDGAHVWCHNRSHDEPFVDIALGVEPDVKSWHCSYRLARHLLPQAPAFGNQVLRYWLKTAPESEGLGAHRAIDDVYVSLENTYHIWQVAAGRGLTTQQELLGLCNAVIPVTMMHFGKHAGKGFEEIPTSYFEWALSPEGLTDSDEDLIESMKVELELRRADPSRGPTVVPATVLDFGKPHRGKLIADVPTDYLEWMVTSNVRCSEELRAGVRLELQRRTSSSPAVAHSQSGGAADAPQDRDIAEVTYSRLRQMVTKGSDEEARLRAVADAPDPKAAFIEYLKGYAADDPASYEEVANRAGPKTGAWMRSLIDAPRHAAHMHPAADAAAPSAPQGAGRISLLRRQDDEPEVDGEDAPAMESETEGVPASFPPAAARRAMRPR